MLNENIAKMRKSKGLTQVEFAKKLHVTQSAVSHWESGRSVPDTVQLFRLAEFFGVSIEELHDSPTTGIQPEETPPTQTETPPVDPNRGPEEYNIMARGGFSMDKYKRLSLEDKRVVDDMVNRLFELAFGKE